MNKKAKRYQRAKMISFFLYFFFFLILLLIFFNFFSLPLFLKIEKLISFSPGKVFLYMFFFYIFFLPLIFFFYYVNDFFLEKKFGLLRENFFLWIKDFLKKRLIELILLLIFVEFLFFFTKFSLWWVYLSIFCFFILFLLAEITPYFLLPIFLKIVPSQDKDLEERVKKLAEKFSLKIDKVWVADFSQRTEKVNALVSGIRKRRMILADNILGKFSPSEIEVICAHEFAHLKNKDIFKVLLIEGAFYFFLFYSLKKIWDLYFSGLLFLPQLPLFFFFLIILLFLYTPLKNIFYRSIEKSADILALKVTCNPQDFISCMHKLAAQNLVEERPSLFRKIFFYTHPSIEERINLAKRWQKKRIQKEENI